MHWVSAADAVPAEVRLYNPLFAKPDPDAGENFAADLNPNSLEVLADARLEPALADAEYRRSRCSSSARAISAATRIRRRGKPVFNRTVGLRDTLAKGRGQGCRQGECRRLSANSVRVHNRSPRPTCA